MPAFLLNQALGHSTQGHPTSTKPTLEATLLKQFHPSPVLEHKHAAAVVVLPAVSKHSLKYHVWPWPPFVPLHLKGRPPASPPAET